MFDAVRRRFAACCLCSLKCALVCAARRGAVSSRSATQSILASALFCSSAMASRMRAIRATTAAAVLARASRLALARAPASATHALAAAAAAAASACAPRPLPRCIGQPCRGISYTQPRSHNSASTSSSAPVDASSGAGRRQSKPPSPSASKSPTLPPSADSTAASPSPSKESYLALRTRELRDAGLCDEAGAFRFPNHRRPTLSLAEFIERYSALAAGQKSTDATPVALVGRLASKRDASSKLVFYDLIGGRLPEDTVDSVLDAKDRAKVPEDGGMARVQVMATLAAWKGTEADAASGLSADSAAAAAPVPADVSAHFKSFNHVLKKGDLVWLSGTPAKTKLGQLSLVPTRIELLAPCWHELPRELSDPNTRYRQRYLDMLVNRPILSTFALRSRVLSALRGFLTSNGFTEVETPIVWTSHGGASAKPFKTSSTALGSEKLPLFLRIAPELFLKQLVIGGLDRVFEVSKVFRNEGIDATHNPEFTTVEFYRAHATYRDLMQFTEELLLAVAKQSLLRGQTAVSVPHKFKPDESVSIDFSARPYASIDIMSGLAAALGVAESDMPDPNADSSLPWYLEQCARLQLSVGLPHTLPRVLDKLIGALLEPQCVQPTFLLHHPSCMSPLARPHPTRPGLTERFELFINGSEYANAYSELNDPADQLRRMEAQARAANAGDEEAQPVDAEFCTALEYGLPPTAGWGLGVDRLVMLLAGTQHIRDVLLFPIMKPQQQQQQAAPQNAPAAATR